MRYTNITKQDIKKIEEILKTKFKRYGIDKTYARFGTEGVTFFDKYMIDALSKERYTFFYINFIEKIITIQKEVKA